MYDPLSPPSDASPEGSIVVFRGVEPSMATLTVTAKDADIPLGSSTPHEVAPLCKMDPMDIKDKYTTELPLAIVADDDTGGTAAVAQASVDNQSSSEQSGEATAAASVTAIQPTCTVTLRITYKPSPKDQREELYELLNKTSQRKATALDNLRKLSMQQSAAKSDAAASSSSEGTGAKPSVKPGFLNKGGKEKENGSKWKKFYDRALSPESMVRRGAMIGFALKDFFIFFGAITFFHFKGQLLAIPPPV